MKQIFLSRGLVTWVSDRDYTALKTYNWWALTSGTGPVYAARKERLGPKQWRVVLMHRQIKDARPDQKVDHKNGKSLFNLRRNLRFATDQQNQRGFKTPRKNKTSKFRGVCWHKQRQAWVAAISYGNSRSKHIGVFHNQVDAAKAYDSAARKAFGRFACLNFK